MQTALEGGILTGVDVWERLHARFKDLGFAIIRILQFHSSYFLISSTEDTQDLRAEEVEVQDEEEEKEEEDGVFSKEDINMHYESLSAIQLATESIIRSS